jgi:hypothetical protein
VENVEPAGTPKVTGMFYCPHWLIFSSTYGCDESRVVRKLRIFGPSVRTSLRAAEFLSTPFNHQSTVNVTFRVETDAL